MPQPLPLPTHDDGPRRERADAARNRGKILAAAEALFAERGVENVSMDDIAERACVGKGTLYRRFGDRSSLALALLDQQESEFQEAFVRGPAPLGPGAPPRERLIAFFERAYELLDAKIDLIFDSETAAPGARFRSAVYGAYHLHVAMLVRELVPDIDAAVMAHLLLAPLAADLNRTLQGTGHGSRDALAAVRRLVDGLAATAPG